MSPGGSDTDRVVDGDGRQAKTVKTETILEDTFITTTLYLRSSVLGGEVVNEISDGGGKHRGFVYAGNQVLAWQQAWPDYGIDHVLWEHRDPSNSSFRTTLASGAVNTTVMNDGGPAELDPTGANAGLTDPYQGGPPPDGGSLLPYPSFGSSGQPGTKYSVDGIPVPLDYFIGQLDFFLQGQFGLVEHLGRTKVKEKDFPKPKPPGDIDYPTLKLPVGRQPLWLIDLLSEPQDTKVAPQSAGGSLGNPFKSLTPFQSKLNTCTKQLFGVELQSFTRSRDGHNGSFTGYGADAYGAGGSDTQITVVNEVNAYTSNQLGAMAGPGYSGVMGLTGSTPSGYTPYRNFTASDLTNSRAILATQVHELGNSLRRITRVTMDPNPQPVPSGDHDPGTRLEKCVFGGEVDWNGHLHHY